jgi:HPt (histidine-containing phosphotransfer) domain-containing protein
MCIEGNQKELEIAAHTLKGSAGNLGANPLSAMSFELEEKARSGFARECERSIGQIGKRVETR